MAKKLAAYWDWLSDAEVSDARIVVCAPGFVAGASVRALNLAALYAANGGTLVSEASELLGVATLPALYVVRQSEVELRAMAPFFKVKTRRRALVCSPTEPLDLRWALRPDLARYNAREDFERHGRWGGCGFCPWVDGRRDPQACERSAESDHKLMNEWVDVVFVVGGDKPMYPDSVRSIGEQCRAAGVPVVFMSWGRYHPIMGGGNIENRGRPGGERLDGARYDIISGECVFADVGAERSGALLDGAPVQDVPAWLGQTSRDAGLEALVTKTNNFG